MRKGKERKNIYIAILLSISKRSDTDHTVLSANYTTQVITPFLRKRSPDGATPTEVADYYYPTTTTATTRSLTCHMSATSDESQADV